MKVQRNKVTTGSIGVVSKSCHKLQLYQFALSRWASEICGLSNRPAHAVRLKMYLCSLEILVCSKTRRAKRLKCNTFIMLLSGPEGKDGEEIPDMTVVGIVSAVLTVVSIIVGICFLCYKRRHR